MREWIKFSALVTAIGAVLLVTSFHISPMSPLFLGTLAVVATLFIFAFTASKGGDRNPISHGSAGWAEAGDATDLLTSSDLPLGEGALMLAPSPWSKSQRLDLPYDLTKRHTLIIGPSGSGKGRGFFLWNCANYKGSFVTSDPKSEAWTLTSGFRARAVRYAPRDPDHSAALNWIPLCGKDSHLALLLARAVITADDDNGSKSDAFWEKAESAFLASLFAHAATFTEPTPAAAYDFLTSHAGEDLTGALLKSTNPVARQFAVIFSQTEQKLRGSIIVACATSLVWLADERVRRFTSSTTKPPAFGQIRKQPTSVYWCLAETDVAVLKPLSAIFFTICLHQIKDAEGDVPTNLMLDELANIGRISNLATEIAMVRGRGIGMTIGLQDIAQLEAVYGRAQAKIILGNCNTKIILAGLDYESAEYISRSLGDKTITEERVSKSMRGGLLSGPVTRSISISKHARRLLTADEIRRISEREQIMITVNKRPVYSHRFWYTHSPCTAKAKPLPAARTVPFKMSLGKSIVKPSSSPPPLPDELTA